MFTQMTADVDGALQTCRQWEAELATTPCAEAIVAWRWLFGRSEPAAAVIERVLRWTSVVATVNRRAKALKDTSDLASPSSTLPCGEAADAAAAAGASPVPSSAASDAAACCWFQSDLCAFLKAAEFCQRVLHALSASRFSGALQHASTCRSSKAAREASAPPSTSGIATSWSRSGSASQSARGRRRRHGARKLRGRCSS